MRQTDRPPVGFAIKLVLQVFAGGCRPRLDVDPSRPYLCESFPGCLAPYPGGSQGALLVSSLRTSAFPALGRVGFPCHYPHSDFSEDSDFGTADIPLCSDLRVCSPPRSLPPLQVNSHRAALAFTSGHRTVSLFPYSGYATRLNRAIGGRGLSPPRFAALSAAPLTATSSAGGPSQLVAPGHQLRFHLSVPAGGKPGPLRCNARLGGGT